MMNQNNFVWNRTKQTQRNTYFVKPKLISTTDKTQLIDNRAMIELE